jgi:hypothetical protein
MKQMNAVIKYSLPETGYVRLSQILGNPKANPPIPPLLPISKSTWWARVKAGIYPQPVILGPKISAWKVSEVRALLDDPSA